MFTTDLLRREGQADEQAASAPPVGMYAVVAVVAGFVVLCAAVTASTAALSGPRTERAAPDRPAKSAIAGAEVLRPDLINASVEFPPLAAPQPATGGSGTASAAQNSTGSEGISRSKSGADPNRGDPQDPVLSTVNAFYETVTIDPRQAFGLLDQPMQGSGYQEFRQAWVGVERVRVRVDHIRRDGPNAALVTTSLQGRDGSVLHTLQRLVINPGTQPQITDARLFSVSRS